VSRSAFPDSIGVYHALPDSYTVRNTLGYVPFVLYRLSRTWDEFCLFFFISGFSNDSMITIGALFLVIGAVEKSHIVDFLARKAFGMSGSVNVAKARMYCTCFCLSIFFNNTPLVAI